jgi:hypothetical protein
MSHSQHLTKIVCRVAGAAAAVTAACLIAIAPAMTVTAYSVVPNPKLSSDTTNPHVDGANPHWGLSSPDPHWDSVDKTRHDSVTS